MDIFTILTFVGGLALFLFGMNVMGDGLRGLTGGKPQGWLGRLCRTPLRGVLTGAAVTALVQSSSATTVMVVGFVNSGIMTLRQSAGVIMGANFGTTVTSWLLSLTEISGGGLLLRLLNPDAFTPVLGLVGVFMLMSRRSDSRRQLGYVFLGFAVLISGMSTMSGAVEPLADMPGFVSAFTLFSNPLLGLAAGALLTALIQSSSASVGILQALSVSGVVSIGATVPIIMGQNIGTCITTLLAGLGASKNARRAAFIHLYFNIIGAAALLAVYGVVRLVVSPALFDNAADATSIAVVHTVFNLFSLLLLLPFSRLLERLAVLSVPEKKTEKTALYDRAVSHGFEGCTLLDERFLAVPSFALTMCRAAFTRTCELLRRSIALAVPESGGMRGDSDEIGDTLALIDGYTEGMNVYLARLAGGRIRLRDSEAQLLSRLFSGVAALSRISIHIRDAVSLSLPAGDDARREIAVLYSALGELCDVAFGAFSSGASADAVRAPALYGAVQRLSGEIRQRRILRLLNHELTARQTSDCERLTADAEHIASHVLGIAKTAGRNTDSEQTGDKTPDEGEIARVLAAYRLP